MPTYDIGGQEVPREASQSIADIPQNRTLLIQQLTDNPPLAPDVIPDLKTVNEVFDFYKPQKEVEFETTDGSNRTEHLEFRNLADFGKGGIVKQSTFLNELSHQCEDLQKFVRQLKTNKILKTVLENKEAKAAYMSSVKALLDELEQAE